DPYRHTCSVRLNSFFFYRFVPRSVQFRPHDAGARHCGVWLQRSRLIQGVPSGIRYVIEAVSHNHAMRRISNGRWLQFDDFFGDDLPELGIEAEAHRPLRSTAVLDSNERSVMKVQAVDPVQRMLLPALNPARPLASRIQQRYSTLIVGHEDKGPARQSHRRLG